jgi:type IV pilus assembly protein PilM
MASGKTTIGLDIGSSSVKLIELRLRKHQNQVLTFGIEALPPQAIVDGAIMNSGAVVDAIRALKERLRIKNKSTAMAVSGHSVIIKKISLPVMTESELDEQIQWEAEQYIPFDINDVNIAAQIMNERNAQQQMDVLLVAAKKDMINDYMAVAQEAGLNPVIVDVAAFSVQNAFEINYGLPKNDCISLINIGASTVNINIVANGISSFTRDVAAGGNKLTEEIQKQLNVSYDEAEAYKIGGDVFDESDSVLPQEVESVIQREVEVMAGEVQRSLDFYAHTSTEGAYTKIYLSGGTAKVPALARAIERRARVAVEVMNPFKEFTFANERQYPPGFREAMAPTAAVVVGLGMRQEGE